VRQSIANLAWFWGVSFADANTGMIVGDGGAIYRSMDGGATWVQQSTGIPADYHSVSFIGPDIATVVGGRTIARTMDGGRTWTPQTGSGGGLFGYFGVHFADANHGTIVGDGGTILHTTSGGE
jgi:photosystem II stability/assembly factor-like uncharacterized protein